VYIKEVWGGFGFAGRAVRRCGKGPSAVWKRLFHRSEKAVPFARTVSSAERRETVNFGGRTIQMRKIYVTG